MGLVNTVANNKRPCFWQGGKWGSTPKVVLSRQHTWKMHTCVRARTHARTLVQPSQTVGPELTRKKEFKSALYIIFALFIGVWNIRKAYRQPESPGTFSCTEDQLDVKCCCTPQQSKGCLLCGLEKAWQEGAGLPMPGPFTSCYWQCSLQTCHIIATHQEHFWECRISAEGGTAF